MLRAQQWNSQIWLNGWYKASISRGGDAKRALLTKVFTHNLDIFRDGAYRTESDRVITLWCWRWACRGVSEHCSTRSTSPSSFRGAASSCCWLR